VIGRLGLFSTILFYLEQKEQLEQINENRHLRGNDTGTALEHFCKLEQVGPFANSLPAPSCSLVMIALSVGFMW
jgi:hypothetical protein